MARPSKRCISGGCPIEALRCRPRRAQTEGPQRVTVRGRDAVVVISAEELGRLLPDERRLPYVEFMESLHVAGLDLDREPDYGRDVEL